MSTYLHFQKLNLFTYQHGCCSKYEGSTVTNPSLTIKNTASGDAGTYYCYATNSVGTGGSTHVVIGVTGSKYFFLIAQLFISYKGRTKFWLHSKIGNS
jgi:hypothetical protein